MRVFHDDVRDAPEGWTLARTNEEAKSLLSAFSVLAISLDHDLGAKPEEGIYAKGQAEENGLQLVEWMIQWGMVPETVIIHSWNPPARERMWFALSDAGHEAVIRPYEVP